MFKYNKIMPVLKHRAKTAYRNVEVQLHTFTILALDGTSLVLHPSHSTPLVDPSQ
jgi:hypothetical protein